MHGAFARSRPGCFRPQCCRWVWPVAAAAVLAMMPSRAAELMADGSTELAGLPESHSSFFTGKFSLEISPRHDVVHEWPALDVYYSGASVKLSSVLRHLTPSDD